MTVVASVVPLMTTTEDETNWLPFTVRRKPSCTSANVIVVAERDPITGAGRVFPQKGLSALQPGKNSKESKSALSGSKRALIRFIWHRTPDGLRESTKGTSNSPEKRWRCGSYFRGLCDNRGSTQNSLWCRINSRPGVPTPSKLGRLPPSNPPTAPVQPG